MKKKQSKNIKIKKVLLLFSAILLVIIYSCEKDKEQTSYKYLVSSQKVKSIAALDAKLLLSYVPANIQDVQSIIDNTIYNVDVFKIVYKTTFKNTEIKASGLICVPDASETFPLLSFQNGTNTQNSNAPSQSLINLQYTLLQSLSGNGYIILMADYLGFGESNNILHPYYHRESNDAAIVDLIYACDEFLVDNKVKALDDGKLFMMGYSQGGWATLSALAELESKPSFQKEIVAASCGAGAYNVTAVAKYIFQLDEYPAPFYLPYFVESHIRNGFLDGPIQKYFNEPYASLIPGLFDGTKGGSAINAQLNHQVSLLISSNLIENFESGTDFQALRNELTINSVEAWPADTRILFFHGSADDNVPPFESQNIYHDFIDKGLSPPQVNLIMADTLTHETGLMPWGISTLLWFNVLKTGNK